MKKKEEVLIQVFKEESEDKGLLEGSLKKVLKLSSIKKTIHQLFSFDSFDSTQYQCVCV